MGETRYAAAAVTGDIEVGDRLLLTQAPAFALLVVVVLVVVVLARQRRRRAARS
jgi:hypothetical protein